MLELIICTLGCGAMLIAEHMMLWAAPWRLSRPAAYCVGVGTLGVWFSLWGLWIGQPGVGLAFLYLACGSGVPIIIAYWLRERLGMVEQRGRRAGRAGARPLSQELIDGGGAGGANE